jgi:peptide/nickel transport system substrate-binding protein
VRRLASLLLLGLIACTPNTPAAQPSVSATASPQPAATPPAKYEAEPARHPGGVVTVGDWQFPPALPPVYGTASAGAAAIQQTLFSGLVGIDPSLAPYGDLARTVPTLENGGVKTVGAGMDVTYDLRPGLNWSDGRPITADDVIFTWQATGRTEGYDRISGIDKRGELGLTVHFASLYPSYLLLFGAIAPKHRLDTIGPGQLAGDPYWSKPDVVSGPFAVLEAVPADHYTLQRNPHYADGRAEMPLLNHAAHLEKIVFKAFASKSATLAALKAGDIQVALELNERDLEVASGIRDARLQAVPWLAYEQVTLNQQAPLWTADPPLRAAIAQAVDVGAISTLLRGRAPAARGPISPQVAWAYSADSAAPRYDLEAAKAALDADGWAPGGDGIRAKAGRRLQFTLSTVADSPLRASEEEALVAGWRRAGMDARLQNYSSGQLFAAYADGGVLSLGAFDAALFAWITPPDPDANFATLHSSRIPGPQNPSGQNFARCADPAIDGALAAGRATLDQPQRAAAYRQFQVAYAKAGCEVPLYQRLDVGLSSERLHNFAPNPAGPGNTWNVADWWIEA